MESRRILLDLPDDASAWTRLGVYLGSFDPLHRGHEWVAGQLLDRCGRALLLTPARHFHKSIRYPDNATPGQRLAMIRMLALRAPGFVAGGVAEEGLFVRLARCLEGLFPEAELTFAMGDETYERFLRSHEYYARAGLAWTPEDAAAFEALRGRVLVVGRGGDGPGRLSVPAGIRWISSTRVRAAVASLRRIPRDAPWLRQELAAAMSPDILEFVLRSGLYVPAPEPVGQGVRS